MALLKVSKGMFNNNNNKIMNKIAVLWQTLVTAGKHCVTVVNSRGHIPEVMVVQGGSLARFTNRKNSESQITAI